jgi:hypothetical protein
MTEARIRLFPKQSKILDLIKNSPATIIGVGGGRGGAKSSGIDRTAITMMHEVDGITICCVMRTWVKQMVPFHLEPILRDFPWLDKNLKTSPPAMMRVGKSRMEFKYAENYDDVVNSFRSGNYDLVYIDQAEQFTWREIVEIRKACRSTKLKAAKIVLIFNMRGASIQEFRKRFYLHELPPGQDPADYAFLKVSPWDNVEWVRGALAEDCYTENDYYSWTDEQRKSYAATRGPYTKTLANDDPVIAKADWEGSWDSLEGAYFANSFDLEKTRLEPHQIGRIVKPWAVRWMAQDWGRSHWCVNYWCLRVRLSPEEVRKGLGWDWIFPDSLEVVLFYREYIVNEKESMDVARDLIRETPAGERTQLRSFFGSPDAFSKRDSVNTIASQHNKELKLAGMPLMTEADNERKGGWSLFSELLKATKCHGVDPESGTPYPMVLLISSSCPELLNSIPLAMRDDKDIDDVAKTDKSVAKIEQDCLDAARYALKTMLRPRAKTKEEKHQERMDAASPAERMVINFKHQRELEQQKKRRLGKLLPSWRR